MNPPCPSMIVVPFPTFVPFPISRCPAKPLWSTPTRSWALPLSLSPMEDSSFFQQRGRSRHCLLKMYWCAPPLEWLTALPISTGFSTKRSTNAGTSPLPRHHFMLQLLEVNLRTNSSAKLAWNLPNSSQLHKENRHKVWSDDFLKKLVSKKCSHNSLSWKAF